MKAVLSDTLPKFAVALGVTLLLAACAGTPRDAGNESTEATPAAATAAPETANTVAATEGGEDEIVCRNEQRTGTAFKTRTCMTREEWRITQRGQRRVIEEMARRTREDASVGAAATQGVPQGPTTATFP